MKTIIAISGPSGSGKSTLTEGLLKLGRKFCPHITTRPKRADDIDGFYRYISKDAFMVLKEKDEFAFCSGDTVNSYGVLKSDINNILSENNSVVVNCSYKDLDNLKKMERDDLRVYIVILTFENIMKGIEERTKHRTWPKEVKNNRIYNNKKDWDLYLYSIYKNADNVIFTEKFTPKEILKNVLSKIYNLYENRPSLNRSNSESFLTNLNSKENKLSDISFDL